MNGSRFLLIILLVVIVGESCKKTTDSNANVLLYNASWSSAAISAAWNGNTLTATPVAQGQSSGTATRPYLQAPAGTSLVTLQSGTDTLINKNIYTAAATGTSFLFYDTTANVVAGARLNILQLTDDLSVPDTAEIRYRFIDLAPETTATTDVWLVNGVTDSIRLDTAAVYIGASALASSVQSFTDMKYHGQAYTIKMKKSGTEQLYASIPNYVFTVRGTYTIIFSGLSSGTGNSGFKLSVLDHTQ